jgi:hypothetical protein
MRKSIPVSRQLALFSLGVALVLLLASLYGCASMGGKSWAQMSPKERATQIMSIYNDQYELYLREAKIPELTEAKKEVLREKKKLLTELYPYIGMYSGYAEKDIFAPADIEMAVMSVMDKLLGL